MHKIIKIKPVGNFKIEVKFADGIKGIIDLSRLIGKGVFASLKDPKQFRKAYIDSENHTITWPNGIDLCPYTIYDEIRMKKAR